MENTFGLSLIFPENKAGKSFHLPGGLSDSTADSLGLSELFPLSHASPGDFFTDDAEVLQYRQKTIADLLNVPEISSVLSRMLPYLTDITDLRSMSDSSDGDGVAYLYSITEIEIYVSLMEYLKKELLPLKSRFTSPAMLRFSERISELCEGEYFKTLTEKLSSLASRVREIRSVTLGINLDRRMIPESSGVISVNSEKFKSGDFFEKVKRLDFRKDEMTYLSELIPYSENQPENQRQALINAVNNAISDTFKTSLKSWKNAIQYYVLSNTDFLIQMIPEIDFLLCSEKLLRSLKERGCELCTPTVTCDGELHADGLINPAIALKTDGELIPNDIDFDENGKIFVITGPNRGGKSVITCAVGLALSLAQMGLFVTSHAFSFSPADKIMTHFPTGGDDTVDKGRLGEECARLREIFENVTKKSLVLLDESLSSTGSYEGAYIATGVLEGFSLAGCRCIFSTHLHDLAASVDRINGKCIPNGGVKIDNMVAEVKEGDRTFRIIRKAPDGKSYAADIAEKYGLSPENIKNMINDNKKA